MSASKNNQPDSGSTTRTIQVKALARVEGEGALHLVMRGDQVEQVQLKIYEPPRFYEAFLRGRDYTEVPDITARICGICPIAYQTASSYALEKAMGVFDDVQALPQVQALRDLIYCGEWIESHVLHMFMLHLPDFLGYESALTMAADHGPAVKKALALKKVGNQIVALLGGRAVHPVGMCVGGFHRAPDEEAVAELLPAVREALEVMSELTLFLAEKIEYPDLVRDYEFVSLFPDQGYPMNLGRIRSNKGLDVAQEEFGAAVQERHAAHTTALQSVIKGRGAYMVGPLARLNLCHDKLHPRAAELLPKVCKLLKQKLPWRNNFLSLPARAIETVHALALAVDIMASYKRPDRCRVVITPRAAHGAHGTEAPRGVCWHEYDTDADGSIRHAHIMPPTAQNQITIEEDLRDLAAQIVGLSDEDAALRCEHLIRNYDPCISCSVHFLKFKRTQLPAVEATS
ncbi:MAG: Ni/Fe hydrogenase subunit alpha [Phycisphaeraceae bacterium]|nr:Ni/Fe hydrogenase subunit alpha [Phycisphaeraceae bacterium]